MERKNKAIIFGLIILIGITVLGLNYFEQDTSSADVVATFYPFYTITEQIAGESVEVSSLVPPGTEPHSFELSPSDRRKVQEADVFVATGVSFEAWEDNIVESIEGEVRTVNSSKGIELIPADQTPSHSHDHEDEHYDEHEDEHHDEHHDDHEDEHSHDHHHGEYDPHYWVSPKNAQIIAENVFEALVEEYPEKEEELTANYEEFVSELGVLETTFSEGLENCEKDVIITTHAAFAYLGNDYGFEQAPIHGLSPLSEPSPSQIQGLVDLAEDHGLEYVFYEEMVDPRVSENIAEQAGVDTLVLNPVAGTVGDIEEFIPIMENNYENLVKALECDR